MGRRYPLFPRLLFVMDGTGPADIENRNSVLRAATRELALYGFEHEVPVLVAALTDGFRTVSPHWCGAPVQDPRQPGPWNRARGRSYVMHVTQTL